MFSMTQLVRRAAQNHGGVLATHDGNRSQTWAQFSERIARFAGGLHKLGVGAGDRVAILALNSDRYMEFMFGVPWAGAVFVPVNTRLAGPEIAYWLKDSGSKVLLVDGNFAAGVAAIRDQLESLEQLVFIDDGAVPEGCVPYAELLSAPAVPDAGRGDDDLAGLFYTGGTTGRSKGVMLSHRNLVGNVFQTLPVIGSNEGERTLHVAPMFHIADGFMCIIAAAMAHENYILPAFEPLATMRAIAEHRIDRVLMVPTMINMFVHHEQVGDHDLSSLRTVVYGASPMPEAVITRALEVLPDAQFFQAYGQTEASPILTVLRPEYHTIEGEHAGKLKSAGRSVLGVDLAVLDDDGNEVALGTVGEICAKGPNVMLGYRNLDEQTREALKDGWLHTGDGGYLDEDGFLFIVDRVKDMIVSGGENVFSAEVENAIYQHPDVDQCAVVGIPSDKWGEQVHAIIVPKPGTAPTEESIITFCREQIAGFKCPRSIVFRDEPLPLSGAGKILKNELRAPYWEGVDRAVN
ncbi:MAG: long-chain-fatty-acid--CoA ligase [Gammaproteobacteria bacterium]|nr:MAG: long-chain-fatty-acid--CoA ligase [Gammaproteobacteria bacterium]